MQRSCEVYEYRTYGSSTEMVPGVLSNTYSNSDPQVIFNNMFTWDKRDDSRTYHQLVPRYGLHEEPEAQEKVENIKTKEVDKWQNRELVKETNIDMEAEGFIKRKHKNFEKSNTAKLW